ncbi:hypothetical protein [Achromobacter arsenitoxydans]|uniref:hypothetical protein n=1 Tax=Achromobacter arsenitoxydans TaxID=1147684 RepID=UPI00111187FC|nr:hypothetical protein [Achromobacter arsenitoxydans]
MTLTQDREERCNKVLARRFKAQRRTGGAPDEKNAPTEGAPAKSSTVLQTDLLVTSLNGV